MPLRAPTQSKPEAIKESLEAKKMRLRKATREFESFFMLHMLKAMRKTIPKTDLLNGGLGQDVYTSMFDEELARKVAGNSPNSLSELLYKSLEKHLEATAAGEYENATGKIDTSIEEVPRIETGKFNRTKISEIGNRDAKTNKDMPKISGPQIPVTPVPKMKSDPVLSEYGPTIDRASREFDVDPRLIYSVILAESGGRPDAVSDKGAKGLMQLIDSTATEMGVADSLDPHQNIIGGTKYLRQLINRFDGNLKLALAAYNAGPGTVSKYRGVPPYPETQRYIEDVLGRLHTGSSH